MRPTSKRGSVDLAGKGEAHIPSLVTDLASPKPAVRTKARKALVAVGKPAVPASVDGVECDRYFGLVQCIAQQFALVMGDQWVKLTVDGQDDADRAQIVYVRLHRARHG